MESEYQCIKVPNQNPGQRVIQGFQYTFNDAPKAFTAIEKVKFADSILDHIFKLGGKMVIAFPDAAPAEVRNYGISILPPNHILESNQCSAAKVKDYGGKPIPGTKHPVQRSFGAKSDLDDEKKLSVKEHIKRHEGMVHMSASSSTSEEHIKRHEGMVPLSAPLPTMVPLSAPLPTMVPLSAPLPTSNTGRLEVTIVGITITDLTDVLTIHDTITGVGYDPNISLVELKTESGTEALSVTTANSPITFIDYSLQHDGDAIRFYRVRYDNNKIIWISFKTRLPIAVRQQNNNDRSLYVVENPPPAAGTNRNNLRIRLEEIIRDSQSSALFAEHNLVGVPLIIHEYGGTEEDRISKREADGSAMIDNTDMEFFVNRLSTFIIGSTD